MFSRCSGLCLGVLFVIIAVKTTEAQNWQGYLERYRVWSYYRCSRCLCRYWWGCAYWRTYSCSRLIYATRCKAGWRHAGNYNCNIPICLPNCGTVGECTNPNSCDCKGLAEGAYCQTLICSYDQPCYPGNCYDNNKCNCTDGFTKTDTRSDEGCLKVDLMNKPAIGRSTTIISHLRDTDNSLLFNFLLDGTDETINRVVWSNQRVFNKIDFEFEVKYDEENDLPGRPGYIHDANIGIVEGKVQMRIYDYQNVEHPTQKYDTDCPGADNSNPLQVFNCTIRGQEFKTLLEHADTLEVTLIAKNGGYRRRNKLGTIQPYEYFTGQTATRTVYFKFDFQAPKHCSEPNVTGYTITVCGSNATILDIGPEFTKEPIDVYWKDWTDDKYGSQMWMYYLELHNLTVTDATLELTESNPVGPTQSAEVMHMGDVTHSHTFTPAKPGMYSILLEVRDIANNSRTARRLVLYDNVSDVEVNDDSENGLHISSAESHTGFLWQSAGIEGVDTNIVVDWAGYFMNEAHQQGHYLNKVKQFPVQFNKVLDDGILSASKFVDEPLDDNTGSRTLDSIPNLLGIVRYDYQYSEQINRVDPNGDWQDVTPLNHSVTITKRLSSGDQLKVWVRAHDALDNVKTASTMVTVDFSPPTVSSTDDNTTTFIVLNDPDGSYNYSSRVQLIASDDVSGVREIGLEVTIHMPDSEDIHVNKIVEANMDDTRNPDNHDPCVTSRDKSTCFLEDQTIFIDNCWLTALDQKYLSIASATLNVVVYNQAMQTNNITFNIPSISDLSGLVEYSGPQNVRIEDRKTGSFRVSWDLPEKLSCYVIDTDIIIVLLEKNADGSFTPITHRVSGSTTYFDIGSLEADTEYSIEFASHIGGVITEESMQLSVRTEAIAEDGGVTVALVVTVAVGVLAIVAIVIVIFVILVRRGYVQPQERVRRVQRAMTKKYRETFHGDPDRVTPRTGQSNPAYDPRGMQKIDNLKSDDLYLYGGMDINMPEVLHIDRDHISFEGIIKDGHFARIYKATLRTGRSQNTVVAKTLKEHFKPDDETLMRAKINFTGTVVGEHPNILKFLGAVTGDDQMGPFIVYEYCENGTLKDYLVSQKNNVTIELQEHLFRFGLDVAKGMEYLASIGIVHRRLAARNILLNFLNEVKISGFGPQPAEDADASSGKQERIPIKWMAPECMASTKDATERSDVWSYAVVLWEIFTLGETPYPNMKSRDLPMRIKKGERLTKPEQCDDTWYNVMNSCWSYEPSQRPVFSEIQSELGEMFVASSGDDFYYYKR